MTEISLHQCTDIADDQALADCLRSALASLPSGSLPLQAACEQGGLVDDSDISVSVLGITRTREATVARVGVFFTEVVGGCNCHDDPVRATGHCMLEAVIRGPDGSTTIKPLAD